MILNHLIDETIINSKHKQRNIEHNKVLSLFRFSFWFAVCNLYKIFSFLAFTRNINLPFFLIKCIVNR